MRRERAEGSVMHGVSHDTERSGAGHSAAQGPLGRRAIGWRCGAGRYSGVRRLLCAWRSPPG